MYLSHFNLQERPFKVSTDPKFLWLGQRYQEALETLRYGILYGDGYVVLTGDVGTGKTTLAMALAKDLSDKAIVARVPYPDVEVLDFLKLISAGFGIESEIQSKASFRDRFGSFLRDRFAVGGKAVLILDEAQRMQHDHLEELLQLSSVEENGVGLLSIVFVGQNEFNEILQEDSNRALRQRIAINCNLVPLTRAETELYIFHRLGVVHGRREIFTPEAIQEIFLYSNGIPRLINVVCDLALLMAYTEGGEVVGPGAVKQGVERLRLPGERPEFTAAGIDHPPAHSKKAEEEAPAPKCVEVRQEVLREKPRKKANSKVLWAGGLALVAALGMLVLLLGRGSDRPQDRKVEAANKKESQGAASPVEVKSPRDQGVGDAAALPEKEPTVLQGVDKGLDPSVQGKASVGPGQSKPKKKVTPAAVSSEAQKGTGPATPGGPVQKSIVESLGGTKVPPQREKDSGEDGSPTLGPASGSSVREPQEKGTEEAEPGMAIDWLLEKRERK